MINVESVPKTKLSLLVETKAVDLAIEGLITDDQSETVTSCHHLDTLLKERTTDEFGSQLFVSLKVIEGLEELQVLFVLFEAVGEVVSDTLLGNIATPFVLHEVTPGVQTSHVLLGTDWSSLGPEFDQVLLFLRQVLLGLFPGLDLLL